MPQGVTERKRKTDVKTHMNTVLLLLQPFIG